MKLQLASDLHLERLQNGGRGAHARVVVPAPDADLLVLAGDIHRGAAAVAAFANWPVPVVYVAGNHEFYNRGWEDTRAELQRAARGTRVHVLDDGRIDFGSVRILGCTLWTDFQWPGMLHDACLQAVDAKLDRHQIQTRNGLLRSHQLLADHERSRHWLERELARPFDGCTVVVSHHGPHPRSVHPRHRGSPLNAAFVSDLSPLLAGVDLWLHGHVHDSADYQVGRCRVVANPAGYALPTAPGQAEGTVPALENTRFDPGLVLLAGRPGWQHRQPSPVASP